MKTHKKINSGERELLANYLAAGKNKPECSRLLDRPLATIKAEVRRNGSWLTNKDGQRVFVYVAITAQAKALSRQQLSAHNKQSLKNPDVFTYVTRELRGGWSPEQISGRLKYIDHPGDPHWQISPETIYVWIYQQPKNEQGLFWYEYLRRKQRKRKKQAGRYVHRSHIPDRVSISKRPKDVNKRKVFGHWEGDSIEGKRKSSGAGLHTEVERMSRRIKAAKVSRITSTQALEAQCRIFGREPSCAVKSTTIDNGKETHRHAELRLKFNMDTYHAHPYCSGERGTNEHGNWHIRYYFPKGTDFAMVSEMEVQAVVEEINNRPREILGFKTANEVYYQLVEKELGGTIRT